MDSVFPVRGPWKCDAMRAHWRLSVMKLCGLEVSSCPDLACFSCSTDTPRRRFTTVLTCGRGTHERPGDEGGMPRASRGLDGGEDVACLFGFALDSV